jgi:hypothetical protein
MLTAFTGFFIACILAILYINFEKEWMIITGRVLLAYFFGPMLLAIFSFAIYAIIKGMKKAITWTFEPLKKDKPM